MPRRTSDVYTNHRDDIDVDTMPLKPNLTSIIPKHLPDPDEPTFSCKPDVFYQKMPNPLAWLKLSETGAFVFAELDIRSQLAISRIWKSCWLQFKKKHHDAVLEPLPAWIDYYPRTKLPWPEDHPKHQEWIARGQRLKARDAFMRRWQDMYSFLEEEARPRSPTKLERVLLKYEHDYEPAEFEEAASDGEDSSYATSPEPDRTKDYRVPLDDRQTSPFDEIEEQIEQKQGASRIRSEEATCLLKDLCKMLKVVGPLLGGAARGAPSTKATRVFETAKHLRELADRLDSFGDWIQHAKEELLAPFSDEEPESPEEEIMWGKDVREYDIYHTLYAYDSDM
ncbi:hypothetical protein FISHEDRAFT_70993 [Fistulina hepatica ATCC 64428]|uniref:Uncharacterized protein n=1 Tax=Fistulina hepatica ATCC 64428 TaxID=1128425 RepID=A0A0D7AJ89_9AGAR|nr:hypothetical protein FISHEDRAFT_70993 [Fistulina hepatica ATCC 64428]